MSEENSILCAKPGCGLPMDHPVHDPNYADENGPTGVELARLAQLRYDEPRQLAVIEAAALVRDEARTVGEPDEPWHYEISLASWRMLSYTLDALLTGEPS